MRKNVYMRNYIQEEKTEDYRKKVEPTKEIQQLDLQNILKVLGLETLPTAFRVKHVAKIMDITIGRVYELVRENKIPHKRLSPRNIRFPTGMFLKWWYEEWDGNKNKK